MTRMLPDEQDKLLKELQVLENKTPKEKGAEQGYVMFGLAVIATVTFIILAVNDYMNNSANLLVVIFGIWACFLVSLHASFYGSRLAAIIALSISAALNLALSYNLASSDNSYLSLCLVADTFVLMLVTTLFLDRGYMISIFVLITKNIVIHLITGIELNYLSLILNTIILLVTGSFLLLIMFLFRTAETSRKQTLRAEILALQNQELLGSWESFFRK